MAISVTPNFSTRRYEVRLNGTLHSEHGNRASAITDASKLAEQLGVTLDAGAHRLTAAQERQLARRERGERSRGGWGITRSTRR